MKRVKWPIRATPPCPTFPYGVPEEMVEVEYEAHEAGMLAALGTRLHDDDPEVQRQTMNELLVLHELKAVTGARVLTEGDMIERGLELPRVPDMSLPGTSQVHDVDEPIQTTMIPPEGTESLLFRIPPTARKKLGMVEPDNVGEVEYVREEAIQRADNAVTQEWKDHAHAIIEATCRRKAEFTSEDVWDTGLRKPDTGSADGDALGPAMRRARTAGFCEPTDRTTTETSRAQRHNNPKRIWRSLIFEQRARESA